MAKLTRGVYDKQMFTKEVQETTVPYHFILGFEHFWRNPAICTNSTCLTRDWVFAMRQFLAESKVWYHGLHFTACTSLRNQNIMRFDVTMDWNEKKNSFFLRLEKGNLHISQGLSFLQLRSWSQFRIATANVTKIDFNQDKLLFSKQGN